MQVIGNQAPALTVASLATTTHSRPLDLPTPTTTPAPGAPPHSSYSPHAANEPSSRNGDARIDERRHPLAREHLAEGALALGGPLPAARGDLPALASRMRNPLRQWSRLASNATSRLTARGRVFGMARV